MDEFSFRVVEDAEFPVFRQYLLPDAARLAAGGKHDVLVLGAVCGTMACGAAALRFEAQDSGAVVAELISLFLDPLVRRQDVGSAFLACCLDAAGECGADWLYAQYVGDEETMAALDALFRRFGAEPEFHLPIYEIDIAKFHDVRLVKGAFAPEYRRPAHIVPFTELTPEQLAALEADPELAWYVDPAKRVNMRPDLSLAYLVDGQVCGFWLGSMSAMDRFSVQGVWHNSKVPPSCFHELIHAHLNLCWYYGGGDFLYYVSPAVEFADKLIQKYSGGDYRRMDEHSVTIALYEDAEAPEEDAPQEAADDNNEEEST